MKFRKELKESITQIRYNSNNLCDIFDDKFSGFRFESDKKFLHQWISLVNSFEETLTKDDIKLLYSFAENLGKTDTDGEISHIRMYIELLTGMIDDAENNINSKSKLYRTFGVSVGLLISILLL